MKAITISRSYGSAGSIFGRELAERLGYDYVDETFITRVAKNKEAALALIPNIEDERSPDFVESVVQLMHTRSYFKTALTIAVHDLVLQRDVVIVGGGGHLVLQGYPAMVSIQVHRNLYDRVLAISNEKGLSHGSALELIDKRDKEKKRFVSHYFDKDLFDPTAFHFTINASYVPMEHALDLMIDYTEKYFRGIDLAEAEIVLHKRLLERRAQLVTFHLDLGHTTKVEFVVPEPRVLVVKGVVGGKDDKATLLRVLRGLKGVDRVEDQLKVGILSRLIY